MTLIVTAMIGNYSIMAADRKQSLNPNFEYLSKLINFNSFEDVSKIVLKENCFFSGTGNASILHSIKEYYIDLIDNDIDKITTDNSKYFEEKSDFNGLNFVISTCLNSGVFLNMFYIQESNKYIFNFLRSDFEIPNNNFKISILNPPDIKNNFIFEYCNKEFSKLNKFDSQTITKSFKKIFRFFSDESKYISSDFNIVFFEKNKVPYIKYIKN